MSNQLVVYDRNRLPQGMHEARMKMQQQYNADIKVYEEKKKAREKEKLKKKMEHVANVKCCAYKKYTLNDQFGAMQISRLQMQEQYDQQLKDGEEERKKAQDLEEQRKKAMEKEKLNKKMEHVANVKCCAYKKYTPGEQQDAMQRARVEMQEQYSQNVYEKEEEKVFEERKTDRQVTCEGEENGSIDHNEKMRKARAQMQEKYNQQKIYVDTLTKKDQQQEKKTGTNSNLDGNIAKKP